jgi:PPM family protein phosphatase
VIADGAGGTSGGAKAADTICSLLPIKENMAHSWVTWLTQCDEKLYTTKECGLAAAVAFSISDDGLISGVSAGDCDVWIFGQGSPIHLTENQFRKPLLGDGKVSPRGFQAQLTRGVLVVATDGLWKYMSHTSIATIVEAHASIKDAAQALARGVRLPNGSLQDDVAIAICELSKL